MRTYGHTVRKTEEVRNRGIGEQGNRETGAQGHREIEEQENRGTGEQRNREAGEQGYRKRPQDYKIMRTYGHTVRKTEEVTNRGTGG